MIAEKRWNDAYDEGLNSYYSGLSSTENPYPYSDDMESPYAAWLTGWECGAAGWD